MTSPAGSVGVCVPPIAGTTSTEGVAGGRATGGNNATEGQAAVGRACTPLLREDDTAATQRRSTRPSIAMSSGGGDREDKRSNALSEVHKIEMMSPERLGEKGASQLRGGLKERGTERPTLPAVGDTTERFSLRQRVGPSPSESLDITPMSYGISSSLMYDASNGAEGATPAASLLQHFTQKEEQHRLSLTQAIRHRCSDAAAALRHGSVSARGPTTPGLLLPLQPSQQESSPLTQEQRRSVPPRHSVGEFVQEIQRPIIKEELNGKEGRFRAATCHDQQHRPSVQGRRSVDTASATMTSEQKEGIAGKRRGTAGGTTWNDLTSRQQHLLHRYAENSEHNSRAWSSPSSDRSSSRVNRKRVGSPDSGKSGRRSVLSAQQQLNLTRNTNGNGNVPSAGAAVAEALMQKHRGSTAAKESQDAVSPGRRHQTSSVATEQMGKYTDQRVEAYNTEASLKEHQGPQVGVETNKVHPTSVVPPHSNRISSSNQEALRILLANKKAPRQKQSQTQSAFSSSKRKKASPLSFVWPCERRGRAQEGDARADYHGTQQQGLNTTANGWRSRQLEALSPVGPPMDANKKGLLKGGGWPTVKGHAQRKLEVEEGGVVVHNALVRGPPLDAHVRAAAANSRAERPGRKSPLRWCLRRRFHHVAEDVFGDDVGDSDAERVKLQVANAAEELPPPHTTVFLSLPDQRARRLRSHVVIEITDGSHRILEVQVAEVLRMLEQLCEEDERQQLLLRQQRRRRRLADREKARLPAGHHRGTSRINATTSSEDSRNHSSVSRWHDDGGFTTETQTGSSIGLRPVRRRLRNSKGSTHFSHHAEQHTAHRDHKKKAGGRRYHCDPNSSSSFDDALRREVRADVLGSSDASTPAHLPSSESCASTHSRGVPTPCTRSAIHARCRNNNMTCAAATEPYMTKKTELASPFVREASNHSPLNSGGKVVAMLLAAECHAAASVDSFSHKSAEKAERGKKDQGWREEQRHCASCDALENTVGEAESPSNTKGLPEDTAHLTSVTLCAGDSKKAKHGRGNMEKENCQNMSERDTADCRSFSEPRKRVVTKHGSRPNSPRCCGRPHCCSGVSPSSSSKSSDIITGKYIDSSKSTSAILSIMQAKKDESRPAVRIESSGGKPSYAYKMGALREASLHDDPEGETTNDDALSARSRKIKGKPYRLQRSTKCRHSCPGHGGRRLRGRSRGECSCCEPCCRRCCCCCSMCCCERCGGGPAAVALHLKQSNNADDQIIRHASSTQSTSSLTSSLCDIMERQHRQLERLQRYQQQQAHWWQLQRQQAGTRIKGKGGGADTGRLTYRDCRQAFTDVHPIPSIEVRRHVVLVCLPPVTCFVLWDRVYLLMTDDLEPDRLISQLSKLTRQYAALQRRSRASTTLGVTSSLSEKSRMQIEEDEQEQMLQQNQYYFGESAGQQQDEVVSSCPSHVPHEDMWQKTETPYSLRNSFPVSTNERRLLHERGYYPHLPAGLKYQQQLRQYQQLSESQGQQEHQQQSREQGSGGSAERSQISPAQRSHLLRPCCSSEDAPQELLEEVEEAAAAAREKAVLSLQEATRSHTAHNKRHSVYSLSCPFAGAMHESVDSEGLHQPRQPQYDSQMLTEFSSPQMINAASSKGATTQFCADGTNEKTTVIRSTQQQQQQLQDRPASEAMNFWKDPPFQEAHEVFAASEMVSSPSERSHVVNSGCGTGEDEATKGYSVVSPTAEKLFACSQEHQGVNVGETERDKHISVEIPLCTIATQDISMQAMPLCSAAPPEASVVTVSPPSLSPLLTVTASSRHQTEGSAAGAAAALVQKRAGPGNRTSSALAVPVAVPFSSSTLQSVAPSMADEPVSGPGKASLSNQQNAVGQRHQKQQQCLQASQDNMVQQEQRGDSEQQGGPQKKKNEGGIHEASIGANEMCEQQQQQQNADAKDTASSGKMACDHSNHQRSGQEKEVVSDWCSKSHSPARRHTHGTPSSGTRSRHSSDRPEKRRATCTARSAMPFEFAALECIFFAAFQQLNFDIVYLEKKFAETQQRAAKRSEASSILLEGLHSLKEPVALYEDRVTAFDKAFDELLSNNVDLHRMELTRLHFNPGLYDFDPHKDEVDPELEILLEYFDQEMDQFKDRVRHLKQGIDNTERLISLRLALMRNRLIQWELAAAVVAAGIAIGTCISGIFGMNLSNGYEDGKESSHDMFTIISAVIAVLAIGSVVVVLYLIRTIVL